MDVCWVESGTFFVSGFCESGFGELCFFFFPFFFLFFGGDPEGGWFWADFFSRVIDTLSNLLEQFGCRCWAVGSSCDACVLEICLRVRKGGEIGEGWLYDLVLSIQEIFCLYHELLISI